jgi:hypothetical protein
VIYRVTFSRLMSLRKVQTTCSESHKAPKLAE